MKRDMDLIRAILLRLEELSIKPGSKYLFYPGHDPLVFEDYSDEQIDFHMHLLVDSGLINGRRQASPGYIVEAMNWVACDFLDKTRNNDVWDYVKETAKKAGGFSVDMLGNLASAYLKKKVTDLTGLSF